VYLFGYNVAAQLGWAYVLYLAALSFHGGLSPSEFWDVVELPLKIVQTAALLEVVHAVLGIVPSQFLATLMQVSSRLIVLWGIMNESSASRAHWSLYVTVGSWALVEVPRYMFYAVNLYVANVPLPLFAARYSLFIALYPSGITGTRVQPPRLARPNQHLILVLAVVSFVSFVRFVRSFLGELLQIWQALPGFKTECLVGWYLCWVAYALYVPGAPFMYKHMMVQRKNAFARRASKGQAPPPVSGIEFPTTKRGDRSTTSAGKEVFAASLRTVDPKEAERVARERDWRFGYAKHVVRNVEISAQSPENALQIARDGLAYLHNNFEFIRDGKTYKLAEAMRTIKSSFETGFIRGTGKRSTTELVVEYKGQHLKGEALRKQLDKWVEYGTIEPEARDAIAWAARDGNADLSDKYFVLLGAGSAMGPLLFLLQYGANIIAVDLDRDFIWKRLIGLVRDSPGTMIFPLKKPQSDIKDDNDLFCSAGCNLFTQTPEIRNWLLTVEPERDLVIGGYAYLDGARHVQVSLAMDAIMQGVTEHRRNVTLAFLCSPTDVFTRPEAAYKASLANLKAAPLWQKLLSAIGAGRILVPNTRKPVVGSSGTLHVVDGIVIAQGPNYALAKRLQHWRAMVARADGIAVSTNIAPSTATHSVVHNKQFAAAYGGMHHFKPMEIMYQETSNAVMGALLLNDAFNPKSVARADLSHPLDLFASGAFHGGIWRAAYKIDSIGEVAALIYYTKTNLPIVGGVLATLIGATAYVVTNGLPKPHTW